MSKANPAGGVLGDMPKGQGETSVNASPRGQLAAELRRIKEESQLSFERLAARTNYSRSSLERFLNGKQLPTAVAVEQLAAVAEEDPRPLLELLSRAVAQAAPGSAIPSSGPMQTAALPPAEVNAPDARIDDRKGLGQIPRHKRFDRRRLLVVAGYVTGGALAGSLITGLLVPAPAPASSARPDGAAGASHSPRQEDPVPGSDDGHVKCESETCLRHDPQAMDCQWDARTAQVTWLRGMRIELRYSPACQAVWGRIEGGTIGDKVIIKDGRGVDLDAAIRFEHDTYTKMLAISPETPLKSVSVCGVIPRQRQMECAPHSEISP
ncbi:helix-turn-helix domain-containing protein [Streptomyces sp. NPDC058964]|uniref:helix-turn-helix domain-containing protein n=1 Tax=Streptomyces sp. NPDC058964 TaxID=3346681 RepID=UPI0036B204E8